MHTRRETAVHSIVPCIERPVDRQELTLIAFLDIEGAFKNVHPEVIMKLLQKINIVTSLVNLILTHFISLYAYEQSTLRRSTTERKVNRGTSLGGVITPLLWVTVVNYLPKLMESDGYNIKAYADGVAIILQGKYPQS